MSTYPSDLEIASAANKISIDKVAATIDITDEDLIKFGDDKAKISSSLTEKLKKNEDGKLICLNKDSSEVYWITELSKYKKGQKVENLNLWLGPYLINNLIYNISYFGELKVVSPISGEILLTESIGVKGALVPPIILSNSIYLSDENSNVYEFK